MYQLIDSKTFGVMFTMDAEQGESASLSTKWTAKPIEDGAELPRFGVTQPRKYKIDGKQTPTPLDGTGTSLQRVIDAWQVLSDLHDQKQPLTAVMGYFTAEVVIATLDANVGANGQIMSISLSFDQIRTVKPKAVNMPKARMKPKVKKRGPKGKKGGAQSAKPATGTAAETAERTRLLKALNFGGLLR